MRKLRSLEFALFWVLTLNGNGGRLMGFGASERLTAQLRAARKKLIKAVRAGDLVRIKKLGSQISLDFHDSETHLTPLLEALQHGQFESVKLLAQLGANPLYRNLQGQSALEIARETHHSLIRWLRPRPHISPPQFPKVLSDSELQLWKQEAYLRHSRRVLAPAVPQKTRASPKHLMALQKNLQSLGFVLSAPLAYTLLHHDPETQGVWFETLLPLLQRRVGAHVEYAPMYPNFPRQVREMPVLDLYLNAVLHYWGDAIGERILPAYAKEQHPLLAEDEVARAQVLELGSESDFKGLFQQILRAQSAPSAESMHDIAYFIQYLGAESVAALPSEIPNREVLAYLCAALLRFGQPGMQNQIKAEILRRCTGATDALRLAVALSGGDLSLGELTRFVSLKRAHRRLVLKIVENDAQRLENMQPYKNRWKALGERLHPGEYAKRYPQAQAAFDALRHDKPVTTFNSQVEAAFHGGQPLKALDLLKTRPGLLARRLDHLLRQSPEYEPILACFAQVASQVASNVLLQAWAHFRQRPNPPALRVFFPKGATGKLKAIDRQLPSIPSDICQEVSRICQQALVQRYRKLPPLGKVYLDPALKRFTVPFALRSASKALRTISRGSRLPLPEGGTVRFFIWWKDGRERTDLDLSASLLDANFEAVSTLSYYNLKEFGAHHSGDITSAPEGASEFIDISLKACQFKKVRYILMTVNSYTQQPYCDLPECFAGFMMRQSPDSGEIYEARTVQHRFDLTANTRVAVPLLIDVQERQVFWADLALKNNPEEVNNVHHNLSSLTVISRAILEMRKADLYTLFDCHLQARGVEVFEKSKADVIFSVDEGITPYDITRILAEFI